MSKPKIAIIGAGISGLTLAQALHPDAEVTVFEKARGVGGRMSSRYADAFAFDHGAQCFTARTEAFQEFLAPYTAQGVVQEWRGKVIDIKPDKKTGKRLWFEPHLVASPNMNSLCKAMAKDLNIRVGTEIAAPVKREGNQWQLYAKDNTHLGAFDMLLCTAPPAQTQALVGPWLEADTPVHHASMQGCFALMVGINQPWRQSWIAAKVHDHPIKWISVNSSKPGRDGSVTCLVAHTRHAWAEEHMEAPVEQAQAQLLEGLSQLLPLDRNNIQYLSTHRWRYALVQDAPKTGAYWDASLGLGLTSDWCATSRIEEAWECSQQLLERLGNNRS